MVGLTLNTQKLEFEQFELNSGSFSASISFFFFCRSVGFQKQAPEKKTLGYGPAALGFPRAHSFIHHSLSDKRKSANNTMVPGSRKRRIVLNLEGLCWAIENNIFFAIPIRLLDKEPLFIFHLFFTSPPIGTSRRFCLLGFIYRHTRRRPEKQN